LLTLQRRVSLSLSTHIIERRENQKGGRGLKIDKLLSLCTKETRSDKRSSWDASQDVKKLWKPTEIVPHSVLQNSRGPRSRGRGPTNQLSREWETSHRCREISGTKGGSDPRLCPVKIRCGEDVPPNRPGKNVTPWGKKKKRGDANFSRGGGVTKRLAQVIISQESNHYVSGTDHPMEAILLEEREEARRTETKIQKKGQEIVVSTKREGRRSREKRLLRTVRAVTGERDAWSSPTPHRGEVLKRRARQGKYNSMSGQLERLSAWRGERPPAGRKNSNGGPIRLNK